MAKKKGTDEKAVPDAKARVQAKLKAEGYTCAEGEKAFDLIERYMGDATTTQSQLKNQLDQADETAEGLKVMLDDAMDHKDDAQAKLLMMVNAREGEPEQHISHLIELLKESSSGFADGLHYRSFCLRVTQAIEKIEGPAIRL